MTETLTVVVPAYNERAALAQTLQAVDSAVARSGFQAEIVVVDDGSTDGTGAVAQQLALETPSSVITQENAGRFRARLTGLEAARGEFVLFLDSRVTIHPDSLRFLAERVGGSDDRTVWNAHVHIEQDNPFALFWDTVTRVVFSDYFSSPRTASFGLASFDRYPKGTTCFFAPRDVLLAGFHAFSTGYDDVRHANDDTPIIRSIAATRPINISPGFACTYSARSTLGGFVRHAFHRGTVFVDGHRRRESRFFPLVVAFFPLSLLWAVASRRSGVVAAAPLALIGLAGAATARRVGHRGSTVLAVGSLSPLYAIAHGLGMWRGALLLARGSRSRRRRAS